jgi:mono/diheme cytochrome c family protein
METISDGQLFWVIRNGSPGTGMPAFKNLKDREIWQIVRYLRTFSEKNR